MKILAIIFIVVLHKAVSQTQQATCQFEGSFDYTCVLTLTNPNGFNNFTQIEGNHLTNRTNDDVTTIRATSFSTSTNIPSIICETFRNLKTINFFWIGVQRVDEDSVRSCQFLEVLSLRSNQISVINQNAFVENPELQRVQLDGNNLTSLSENLFQNNRKLIEINLSNNRLTDLPRRLFSGLSELESLHLFQNQLTTINEDTFANLSSLLVLGLSNNTITGVPDQAFASLVNLLDVYLSNNPLGKFNPYWFQNSRSLRSLYLINTQISYFSEESFVNFSRLRELMLNSNPIQKLPSYTFKALGELTTLSLFDCQIIYLDPYLFQGTTNLWSLNLANNQIYELPTGVFSSLVNLATLNLDNNQLQIISSTAFGIHPVLREVRFGWNQINAIDEKFIDNVNVTQLNMLQNICADGFFDDWSVPKDLLRRELQICFENYKEPPPYCPIGNEYERICELEAQSTRLTQENESLRRELDELAARIEALERQNRKK